MHREALADLGESLRRELQDLWYDNPLADLAEDARRLAETLDGQVQALIAWLTSPSVLVDLPPEMPPTPAEWGPARQRTWPAEAARAAASQAERRPAPDTAMDRPAGVEEARGDSPSTDPMPSADKARAVTPRSGSIPILPSAPPLQAASAFDPDPRGQKVALPDGPALTSAFPRNESNATLRAAVHRDAPATHAHQTAPATPTESLRNDADRGELTPLEVGVPSPAARGGFTPAKNLRDLARLMSVGDGAASPLLDPTVASRSDEAGAEVAGGPIPDGESLPAPAEAWRPTESTTRNDELPPPAQRRWAQPPLVVREERSRQDPLPAARSAREMATAFPQEDAAEVDVESLLDALARSVAEDYKRFYGG